MGPHTHVSVYHCSRPLLPPSLVAVVAVVVFKHYHSLVHHSLPKAELWVRTHKLCVSTQPCSLLVFCVLELLTFFTHLFLYFSPSHNSVFSSFLNVEQGLHTERFVLFSPTEARGADI